MNNLFLGIDLGTTNSKAAFLDYRQQSANPLPEILSIEQVTDRSLDVKKRKLDHLPSVVLFNPDGKRVTIGEYARRASVNFPDRSVRAIKRLMGKNWKFSVHGWGTLTPQGISALILRMIRLQAQQHLHDTTNDLDTVSISVPASFGSRQREATREAAKLAGFSGKIHLIDEPSAALIHFIHDRWQYGQAFNRKNRILVFDMGGGTLDVSLAEVEKEKDRLKLSIISRSRYTELAGTEFDLRLAAYIYLRLMHERLEVEDIDKRQVFRALLFDMAEPLKKGMSFLLSDHLQWGWDRFGSPFDFESEDRSIGYTIIPEKRQLDLSKGDFELENLWVPFQDFDVALDPFFISGNQQNPDETGTIYGPIRKALSEVDLSPSDIDIVLLHGGMCELPLIEIGLRQYFPEGVKVEKTPKLMTSVAQGAALYQASKLGREIDIDIEEPALFESVYYEKEQGFDLIVDKNQKAGKFGIVPITFRSGAEKIRLSLYHGFSETDPLLRHDRDLLIELDKNLIGINTIDMRWEVNHDRTVSFSWRETGSQSGWRSLIEASTARGRDWYPPEIRDAERQKIQSAFFED